MVILGIVYGIGFTTLVVWKEDLLSRNPLVAHSKMGAMYPKSWGNSLWLVLIPYSVIDALPVFDPFLLTSRKSHHHTMAVQRSVKTLQKKIMR